jgi:hypothetical protein
MEKKNNISLETYTLLGAILGLHSDYFSVDELEILEKIRRRKNKGILSESSQESLNLLAAEFLMRVTQENSNLIQSEH